MRPSQVVTGGADAPVQKVSYLDKIDDEDVLSALENLRVKKTLRKNGGVGTPPRPPPPSPRSPSPSPSVQDHQSQAETSSTVTITHHVRKNKNTKKTTAAMVTKSMNMKIKKTPSSSNDSQRTASTKSISSILSSDDHDHEEEEEKEKKKMDVLFGNSNTPYYYQVDDDDDLVEENMAHTQQMLQQQRQRQPHLGRTNPTTTKNGNGGVWDKWENIGTSFLQRFSCQPVVTKMVGTCEPLERNIKTNVRDTTSSSSPSSTILGPFHISQESKDRLVQQKEELVHNLKIKFDQMLVNSGTGGDGSDGADGDVDTVLEDAAMAAATASALDDNATATSLYLAHKELREAIADARRTRGPLTSEKRIEVLTLRLRVMSKKVMDKVDDFLFGIDDGEDDEDTAAVREFLNEDDITYLTRSVGDQSFDGEETLGTYLTNETKSKVPNGGQATTNDECSTPPRRGGKGNTKDPTTTAAEVETAKTGPHQPPQLVRKSVTATTEIFDPSLSGASRIRQTVAEGISCGDNVPEDELMVDGHHKTSDSFEVSSLDGGR